MKNGFEWLRLLTPILTGVTLFIVSQMWHEISEINTRLYQHQTNADIHVTRSEFENIRSEIREMRRDVINAIKGGNNG